MTPITTRQPPDGQTTRGWRWDSARVPSRLILAILLSGIAMFMFYPLVVLELRDRGYSLTEAGLVFGLLAGTGQVLAIVIGRVVARFGGKRCALIGLAARVVGLLAMSLAPSLATWALGAVVASLGGSAVVLSLKAELLRTAVARDAVVKRSLAVNIGALVGPGIGGLLYSASSFEIVVLGTLCLYAAVAVLVASVPFERPEDRSAASEEVTPAASMASTSVPLGGAPYARLLTMVAVYWFIYAQLGALVPVLAVDAFHASAAAGWMYMVNALVVIVCQYWLVVRRLKSLGATRLLGLGFSAMCVSALCLLGMPSAALLVAYVVAFSLGELLISPALDEHTAALRGPSGGISKAFGTSATVAGLATLVAPSVYGAALTHAPQAVGVALLGVGLAVLGLLAAGPGRLCSEAKA